MPEISRFFGIVIRMYFNEHGPPHFHAEYAKSKAQVRIEPVGIVRGRLPPRALSLVVEWATRYSSQLRENWRRLRSGELPMPIPPLE